MAMIRRYLPIPKDLSQLILWYERYISPLSLLAGFIADNFILLKRVDVWESEILLFFYLSLAAIGIVLLNAVESGRVRHLRVLAIAPILPVVAQFAFGGLFSAFVSLYSRSAAFVGTWIFVAALVVLLLGNERFRKLYVRFSFQISLYFFALFLFLIFFLPVVLHKIGTQMFLLSGLIAILCISLLLLVLSRVSPEIERRERTRSARSIAVIWFVITALYFSNAIPPLPLALKDAGVYHGVTHLSDGTYVTQGENHQWYEAFLPVAATYHALPGEGALVFTSVFAPTGLSTQILHVWQWYDPVSKAWITRNTLSFTISGGRDGGYRGYSRTFNLTPGKWRVNVVLPSGSVIGRVSFEVITTESSVELKTTNH